MRRRDTGWRDAELTRWHERHGLVAPAPGIHLPMVEYDRGVPVALVNYLRRDWKLPQGPDVVAAYSAFSYLSREDGTSLPFLTVRYDPRNWSYSAVAHNTAGEVFLGSTGWVHMTEHTLAAHLYRLRGRRMPDLTPYGVTFASAPWLMDVGPFSDDDMDPEAWPGASMSQRRRDFEPVEQTRMSWRNPCVDIDFAAIARDGRLSLVVDYKAPGAHLGLRSTNLKALSALHVGGIGPVPAFLVAYSLGGEGDVPLFRVHPVNATSRNFLAYALGTTSDSTGALAATVAGADWIALTGGGWRGVIECALNV